MSPTKVKKITRSKQDTAWKQILDAYFKYFLDYCLPELSQLIDWDRPYISLDKELQAITKGTDTGKRLLDKLFKVYLKNGEEQWILIHLEIQGKKEDAFPKRMFVYGYRIYDKYEKMIVSCAILTDDQKDWRPGHFELKFLGSSLSSDFLIIKLIDYYDKIAELEVSNNPFASVILAQLKALEVKKQPDEQRKQVKFTLTKRLYEKGFTKNEITNLYTFIDWLIELPPPLEIKYLHDVYELEEAKKMPYVSAAERFGIEKGVQQGLQLGLQQGEQRGLQQGLQQGEQRGLQQGLQQGEQRGLLQGVHKGVYKSSIALKMLQKGAAISDIEKETGLTKEEIELLQESL